MKRFLNAHSALISILILLWACSCKKETISSSQYPIPTNLKMVTSGYAAGAATRVVIYAENDLFAGYNQLYIALYDSVSNVRITQAQISLFMSSLSGSGTSLQGVVENPVGTQAYNGLFNCAAVFTSANSNWVLTVQIKGLANQKAGSSVNGINVVQTSPARSYSLTPQNETSSIFVCLVQPYNPQLGVNNLELAIYKQTTTGAYVADSSYQVTMSAEMPAMQGMNSPNNVNPVYTTNGHYLGKVNLIMGGNWQISVGLMKGGIVADSSHYFALSL